MAHFAKLDENNLVTQVVAVKNDVILENEIELEQKGIDFCKSIFGQDTKWVQTSMNTLGGIHSLGGQPLRKNAAGIGDTYDAVKDAFIKPKRFNSWVLNESTCLWEAPISEPTDGPSYLWHEETVSWILNPVQTNPLYQ
jgi:hypothetical protein|tara:strand:- start:626 stop:1042 length:417 start_codon:yes stop_codon:yes gene_type:complete